MISQNRILWLGALTGLLVPLFAPASEARIRCQEGYQRVDGRLIASPYCGDEYLARVARGYGMRVSGSAIRRSISKKDEACRLVGGDNRVRDICIGHRNERDGSDRDRGGRR